MSGPSLEDARRVQAAFDRLSDSLWVAPGPALEEIQALANEAAAWSDKTGHLVAIHLGVQALRALDRLDEASTLALIGLKICDGYPATIAAHLNLELGTCLRQSGNPRGACEPLAAAAGEFTASGDRPGEASALTELGIVHRHLGRLGTAWLLLEAGAAAAGTIDPGRARRARREQFVTMGQRGQTHEALAGLTDLLDVEEPESHSRANVAAEIGHLHAQLGDTTAARSSYMDALDGYHRNSDRLGTGNTERALGSLEAQLGRFPAAKAHLDAAVSAYGAAGYTSSQANAYVEIALIALAEYNADAAVQPAADAWRLYRAGSDRLGLALVHRVIARHAAVYGRRRLAAVAFARSSRYATEVGSKLAVANAALADAETNPDPTRRVAAADQASAAYGEMGAVLGEAHAAGFAATGALELGDSDAALRWLSAGSSALERAAIAHAGAADRADLGLTLIGTRDRLLSAAETLGSNAAVEAQAAELAALGIIESAGPIAIARRLHPPPAHRWDPATAELIATAAQLTPGSPRRSSSLARIADALAFIGPDRQTSLSRPLPTGAQLWVGPPGPSGIPIVHRIGDGHLRLTIQTLDDECADAIDALAASDTQRLADASALWDPSQTAWTDSLRRVLIPSEISDWAEDHEGPLEVRAHGTIAHVPFEALLIGGVPLGALTAVRRSLLGAPSGNPASGRAPTRAIGHHDPALACKLERAAFTGTTGSAGYLRAELGPDQLIWICAHGLPGLALHASIVTSDGTPVIDAADLLAADLSRSTLLLESCWSGRAFGHRFGEQLSLATAALLAGASAVAAAVFPLPISDESTGAITAHLLEALAAGIPADHALLWARRRYLETAPDEIVLSEAGQSVRIPGRSPLAWAGLVCNV